MKLSLINENIKKLFAEFAKLLLVVFVSQFQFGKTEKKGPEDINLRFSTEL